MLVYHTWVSVCTCDVYTCIVHTNHMHMQYTQILPTIVHHMCMPTYIHTSHIHMHTHIANANTGSVMLSSKTTCRKSTVEAELTGDPWVM